MVLQQIAITFALLFDIFTLGAGVAVLEGIAALGDADKFGSARGLGIVPFSAKLQTRAFLNNSKIASRPCRSLMQARFVCSRPFAASTMASS